MKLKSALWMKSLESLEIFIESTLRQTDRPVVLIMSNTSFSMMAILRPSSFVSTWFSNVVFPDPKNPVIICRASQKLVLSFDAEMLEMAKAQKVSRATNAITKEVSLTLCSPNSQPPKRCAEQRKQRTIPRI